jgi:chromosomal replication initiation ATPase DnaA
MDRKQLITFIGSALDVDIMPVTHSVLLDKLKEYEEGYIKKNIRSYNVSSLISDETFDNYAMQICEMYGITIKDLKSKGRYFQLVMARVHFCRYMRIEHNASVTALAKYLNRHHSCVIHYFKKYKLYHQIPENTRFKND